MLGASFAILTTNISIFQNDRPLYPQKIVKTDVITNPFQDIEPRLSVKSATKETAKDDKVKKQGVKWVFLLHYYSIRTYVFS